MKVKELMQHEVVTLGLDDSLDIAEDIMSLGRIRHLPVVTPAKHLVGVVSQRDLLKASVASVLALGRTAEHDWLKAISVRAVMTVDPVTVGPETDLIDALDEMISRKVGCLPVVHGGVLVGLLTETDCLSRLRDVLARASFPVSTQ